jgi:hypothetical protein
MKLWRNSRPTWRCDFSCHYGLYLHLCLWKTMCTEVDITPQ